MSGGGRGGKEGGAWWWWWCEEAKQLFVKPVSAFHEHGEPWIVVGCYLAEWNHSVFETRKVQLWICVDEAAKFTVGHVWAEGQQVGNSGCSRVMELLQERWISVFGRMHTLRTDPEGVWRNKEAHERLSDMQIVLDLHFGEALWLESVKDSTIGIVTDTMTRIALERCWQQLCGAWTCAELGSIIPR